MNMNLSVNVQKKYANILFILWAGGAALLSYSMVYALRKPYTSASFAGLEAWGMDYKVAVTIVQIIGYVLAKFIGIKLVSELRRERRLRFIFASVMLAEVSLLAFAALPMPYNMFAMFFNGLSLGCMWGVILSFLEGRKLTEILACLLGASQILSSGLAKSMGLYAMNTWGIDAFWMPALIGGLALPFLLLCGYALSRLPYPTVEDELHRTARKTMNGVERKSVFNDFKPMLVMLFLSNSMLLVVRNLKEDFLVNIIDVSKYDSWLFTRIDAVIVVIILSLIGTMVLVKDNFRAIRILMAVVLLAVAGTLFVSVHSSQTPWDPIVWLFAQSLCLYIPYEIFQTAFFERFIATFRINGTVSFFIAINDFVGYMGAILVLTMKEFLRPDVNWQSFYNWIAGGVAVLCLVFYTFSYLYLYHRYRCRYHVEQPASMVMTSLAGK